MDYYYIKEQVNYCVPKILQHPELGFKIIAVISDFWLELQTSSKGKIALVLKCLAFNLISSHLILSYLMIDAICTVYA